MTSGGRTLESDPVAAELFAGPGEMRAILRATDWSKTRFGPVEEWPGSLRTMVSVVLGSRFPMLLWWGPDCLHLYNDAYRPILRDKHPASLAAPAAEVWAEIWDVAGPLARSVLRGGPATWMEDLQLFIHSGGMAEETYFTFSYSPVPGDDGRVGGLLNTVQETTAKVQSERQVRMLHDLVVRAAEAESENEAYRIAADVLEANEADLPFTLLYLLTDRADGARLVAASGWPAYSGPARPDRIALDRETSTSWPFAEVVRTGREALVDDLAARFGALPIGSWNAPPERAIVLPLFRVAQTTPYALLVAGISPHRALDTGYRRFFRGTADQLANVIANARAYEAEKTRAEALAEIDRAKTTFFSNVSHEFRTPLTLILGPIEDALAQAGQKLDGDALQTVHRNALRLLRLVNSLLDFARIEAGRLELSFSPVDLAERTADLASSFRSLVEQAGLRLVVTCPALPEPVYVDVAQWEKIVLNLLSNAFKFTLSGEIGVGLRSHGDRVELTVRDSGGGIPAHELPHIFERFHRVEGAKGRSFEGSGIGLSLVHELVKLHGGTIRADSREGEGSTFVVSLPAGRAHLPAERIVDPPSRPAAAAAASYVLDGSMNLASAAAPGPAPREAGGERPRLLVADDNSDMREYLCRLLSGRYRVDAAGNGAAALAFALEHPPDLVLSDVMMPELDGFGLLRALRAHPLTAAIPVVLLSARAGEEALLEGLETGADDYLVKPFAARELLARVQTHLQLARMRREWSDELERANRELEAFSYSVSHDLRAPLRAIDGFSKALLDGHASQLDEHGRRHLERVRAGTQRMGRLIDDLLSLSRITRAPLHRERVDLTALAREVLAELRRQDPGRAVRDRVQDGLVVEGDPQLIQVMLENLLGNAWKFTAKRAAAAIEVGRDGDAGGCYFVRDDGAGFDMQYAGKLFTPFQRLHPQAQFEGTGIGLATVQRVVARHGGRIWAESDAGRGATFYFTLGDRP